MRASFLRRRLLSSLTAVFGVSVLVFLLVHLIPGDPVDNLLGERADPIDKLEMRRCMDLDQPLIVQFGRFVKNVANGTLGHTCPDQRRTVASLIADALPSTIALATAAMVVALILALPLGILAALAPARRARRGRDRDLARRHLHARDVARSVAAGDLLRRPAVATRPRRRPRRAGGPDLARDHARHAPHGDARAHDPLVAARGARRRLRAHRARQGAVADASSSCGTRCATRSCP